MTERDLRVLISIGFLVGLAILLPILGFFTTAAIFLIGHMLYLGIRAPLTLFGVTAGILAAAWVLFERFLGVPLPHGFLY